jgi:hypothetical protein
MSAGGYESWFVSARDLSRRRGAYEYGTREPMPGIAPRPLPEG